MTWTSDERRLRAKAQTILRQLMSELTMERQRYIVLSGALDEPEKSANSYPGETMKKLAKPSAQEMLGVVLDCVDYTSGACRATEMVGAVLPADVIRRARASVEK